MFKQFYGGFCDEDVDAAFNRIKCNWVVGGIRGEDGDCQLQLTTCCSLTTYDLLTCTALWKGVNCCFVRIGICLSFLRILIERDIEAIVCFGNVLL